MENLDPRLDSRPPLDAAVSRSHEKVDRVLPDAGEQPESVGPARLELDYLERLHSSWEIDTPLVPPLAATMNVAARCDSHCLYCDKWRPGRLTEPGLPEIIRVIGEAADLGVERLNLSGGEPLLRADLEDMIVEGSECGLAVGVLTNGRTLTESRLYRLREAGLSFVWLSLDCLDRGLYSRLRGVPPGEAFSALEDVARLQKESPGFFATVLAVLSKPNLPHVVDLVKECERLGVRFQTQPIQVFSQGQRTGLMDQGVLLGRDDGPAVTRVAERIAKSPMSICSTEYLDGMIQSLYGVCDNAAPCYAGYAMLNIDVRLDVRPCWPMPAVGSLRTASVREIWYSAAFSGARARMRRHDCVGCHLLCHSERVRSLRWLIGVDS